MDRMQQCVLLSSRMMPPRFLERTIILTAVTIFALLVILFYAENVAAFHQSEICADDVDFHASMFELDDKKLVTKPWPPPSDKAIEEAKNIAGGNLPAWWWDIVQPRRNQTLIPDWYLHRVRNCTVIDGSVRLRNTYKPTAFAEAVFPNVREITGSVLVLNSNLETLSHVFPNLRVIRGRNVLHNYAFVVLWNDFLENIGLPNLTYIGGAVRIESNKRLCYVNTIDFNRLAPLHIGSHYFNQNAPVCFEQCASNCSVSAETEKSSMTSSSYRRSRQQQRRPHCWSSAANACQRLLPDGCPNGRVPNTTACCHRQCLPAGCSGPKETECVACARVNHNGRCLDTCPPGTYQTEGDFCLTYQQCRNRKMKNDRCMFGARGYKPYFGKCSPECPKNYMEHPTDLNLCIPCNGMCPKVCEGDFSVTDVATAKRLGGCTQVTGNLQIQIRSGPARQVATLREYLGNIEVIGGSLRVIRSVGLKSLNFFDSLHTINGSSLYLGKFAIFIHDNPHLAELFNIPRRPISDSPTAGLPRLEIGRGTIFMESNPKLCLGGIARFIRNITFLTEPHTFEELKKSSNISEYTNGNKGVCEALPLNLTVRAETDKTAYVEFDALPGDYDYRIVLYYTIAWRRLRPEKDNINEISYFDEQDACGASQLWHSVDVEPQFFDHDQMARQNTTIEGLQPNTHYAVVVTCRTTSNVTGHGGPVVFITQGSKPGNLRQLRGEALSSKEIRISWLPPTQLNGNLTGYFLEYRPVRNYKEDYDYSNLCNTTIGSSRSADSIASTAAVISSPAGGAQISNNTEEHDEQGMIDDEGEVVEGGPSIMHHSSEHDNVYAFNHQQFAESQSGDSSGSMLLGSLNGVPCCSCTAPSGGNGHAAGSRDGGGINIPQSYDDGGGYPSYADSDLSEEDARAQHIEFTDAIINSIYLPEHRRCEPEKNVKQWWHYVDNQLVYDQFDGSRFKRSINDKAAPSAALNAQISSPDLRYHPHMLRRQKRQHDVIYPDGSEVPEVPAPTENSTWEELQAYSDWLNRFEPKYSKKYQQTKLRNEQESDSNELLHFNLGDRPLSVQPMSQLTSVILTDLEYFMHYKIYVYAVVRDAYGTEFYLDPESETNINMPYVTIRTTKNETADDIDPDSFELIQDARNHSHVFLRWREPPHPNGNMTSKFEVEVQHEHYSPNYECVSMATYTTLIAHYYTNVSAPPPSSSTTSKSTSTTSFIAAEFREHEWLEAIAVADLPPGVPIGGLKPGQFTFRVRAVSPAGPGAWTPVRTLFIEEPGFGFSTFGNTWALPLIIVLASLGGLAIPSSAAFYFWRRSHKQPPLPTNMTVSVNPDYEWERAFVYEPDEWEVDRDHVKLLREVGKGSFGLVYEGAITLDGIDTPPFRQNPEFLAGANGAGFDNDSTGVQTLRCAVKTVGEAATPFERYEFLHEAGHMKKFSCHHIVSLLGVVSKGQPVLVLMEYMARGDLRTWLRTRRPTAEEPDTQPPTMRQVLKIAAEIADGMMYLAVNKFVHRDLAARNCLVADDLTVKLGDFGMTRDIYQDDYYRKSGRGMLPVRWMAPESLCDGVYTSKSDVWSFGVVLWEMATLGAQPYQGLSNEQTLTFVRDKGVMGKPEGCPEQLFDLMQMCWRYLPTDRPSFAKIIEMLLPDLPPSFNDLSFYRQREAEVLNKEGATPASSASTIDLEAPTLADEEREEFDALLEDDAEAGNLDRKAAGGPHAFKFLNSFLDEGPQSPSIGDDADGGMRGGEFSGVDDIQLQLLPQSSNNNARGGYYGHDEIDAAPVVGNGPLLSGEASVSNTAAGGTRSFNNNNATKNKKDGGGGGDTSGGYTSVMRAVTPTSAHSRATSVAGGELSTSTNNTTVAVSGNEYDPIVGTLPSIIAVPLTTTVLLDAGMPFTDRHQARAKFFASPLPPAADAGTLLPNNTVVQQQPQPTSSSTPSSLHKRSTPPQAVAAAANAPAVPAPVNTRRRISSTATTSSQNSDVADTNSTGYTTATTHIENEFDFSSSRGRPPSPHLGLPLKKQRNSQSATLDTRPMQLTTVTGDIMAAENLGRNAPLNGGGSIGPQHDSGNLHDHRAHSEALLMIMRANPGSNHNFGNNNNHHYINTVSTHLQDSLPSLYPPIPAGIHQQHETAIQPNFGSGSATGSHRQLNGGIWHKPSEAENSAAGNSAAAPAKPTRRRSSAHNEKSPGREQRSLELQQFLHGNNGNINPS